VLSVVIPVYNERDTWRDLLTQVEAVKLEGVGKQFVLVDDNSSDGTREQLQQFADEVASGPPSRDPSYKVLFREHNRGKGAALQTGFAAADGDLVIVQDADLEYDPDDYPALLAPLLAGRADVVYGSRFLRPRARGNWSNFLANRVLTVLSNFTTGLGLTDMETCYKVFRREVIQAITLEQARFGFEPEVTAKIARMGIRIHEVPVHYSPRSRKEGKKIGFTDGLQAIWCILKYGLCSK